MFDVQVCEETGNKDVYTKWKPPKNKLTQERHGLKLYWNKWMENVTDTTL